MLALLTLAIYISAANAGLPILDCNGNWTGGYYPDSVTSAPPCQPTNAVPTQPTGTFTANIGPNFQGSIKANSFSGNTSFTTFRNDKSLNVANVGMLSETDMLFDTEPGMAGASYGMYGIARGTGSIGTWGIHDIVGGYFTAYKDFNGWAAGVHADCIDTVQGGTCVGVNIEFPTIATGTNVIGLNIQPYPGVTGITGIQLQDVEGKSAYKNGIVAANMNFVFGNVDGMPFGLRFDQKTQQLGFFRNIGGNPEIRTAYIDMNYGKSEVMINK